MATITWLDKIDGSDEGNPQHNVNAADMNQIKTAVNTNKSEGDAALALKAPIASPTFTGSVSGITSAMVGLGNVNNTSDAGKPVSTAQQTALDLKANLASPTFTGTVGGVTAAMVGLGNVNNTADSAKPVSTAQQTALDLKITISNLVWNEVPTGLINGSNLIYTIATAPVTGAHLVVVDSAVLSPTTHYTISGTTLTIIGIAPVSQVLIFYLK